MESQVSENFSCVDVQVEQPSHLNSDLDEKFFEMPKATNEFEAVARLREFHKAKHDLFKEEFCKSRDLKKENERLSHMCEQLKKEFDDMAKKLSCNEQTLQQTVLKLNEETCENTRINHIRNVQRKQIACFNEQLYNGMCPDVVLESNDKICTVMAILGESEKAVHDENNNSNNCILKETLTCMGQEPQETKSTLESETGLRGKLNEAYEQLRDEYACVKATLEMTDKTLVCTERKLSIATSNLNSEIYKNKQLHKQNNRLEDEYKRVVEKCDKMNASLYYTQQKLDDIESKFNEEFCNSRDLRKENDRLSHMCELLKKSQLNEEHNICDQHGNIKQECVNVNLVD